MQFLTDGLLEDSPKLSKGCRRASLSIDSSLKDGDIHDDRILGNSLFVERVLGKEKPVEVKRSIEKIIETVSDYYGLNCNKLCWPSKVRKVAAAKAVICFVAIRYLGISGNAVGMRLNYSPTAVSRAKQRGKKIFECEQGLNDILTQMSKCQERP